MQCQLDIAVFTKYFVPKFGITRRYVGTEPLCPVTAQYNAALEATLPEKGVILRQIPRLEAAGTPMSASAVRKHLQNGEFEALKALLPATTYEYLKGHNLTK